MTRKHTFFVPLITLAFLGAWAVTRGAAQEEPKEKPPVEPRWDGDLKPKPEGWPKADFDPRMGGRHKPQGKMPPGLGQPGQTPGFGPGQPGQAPGFGLGEPGKTPGFGPGPGMQPKFPGRPPDGPPQGPPHGPQKPDGWASEFDPELRRIDQAEREVERKCIELSLKHRDAAKDERAAVQKDILALVNKHFDLRQERRELQLKRLEEELQRLRDAIKRRQEVREQIVKQRVGELLGQEPDISF
jgi:hypothetical protein